MNGIYTTLINESLASLYANMKQRISVDDMQRVRVLIHWLLKFTRNSVEKRENHISFIRLLLTESLLQNWNWG